MKFMLQKQRKDDGLDGGNDMKKTMPSHLFAFLLSIIKRFMINFCREINCFYNNSIYYGDTNSLHREQKFWIKQI